MGWFSGPEGIRDVEGPQRVSVTARVTSDNGVISPLSGLRAAVFVVTVLERYVPSQDGLGMGPSSGQEGVADAYRPLGSVVVGETLELQTDAESVRLVLPVAQTTFTPSAQPRSGASTIESAPPAVIAAGVARATGRGAVCYREHPLGTGDRVRVEATVEWRRGLAPTGYRTATERVLVARPDLHPIVVEEIVEVPDW